MIQDSATASRSEVDDSKRRPTQVYLGFTAAHAEMNRWIHTIPPSWIATDFPIKLLEEIAFAALLTALLYFRLVGEICG
jgi:hypothetical protein